MIFKKINEFGKNRVPFLFISDFKALHVEAIPLRELDDISYSIDENYKSSSHSNTFKPTPCSFNSYKEKFDEVISHIESGDSYLLNLTQPTPIESELSLKEIYEKANAHYKLRYKDRFVCFSPEKFISIENNKIDTFPMKGTIDASLSNAKEIILADKKEMAEHIMVVDLLRNDLSIVAKNIKVKEFRYVKKVDKLLQVSSHIEGDLTPLWREHLGNILQSLLPAGSISGTPKKSTIELIEKIENYERGFFSGVFGIFDGDSFDSGVMIRFVQKDKNGYVYKSGGGITLDSDAKLEYNEMIQKIYLP